MKPYYYIFLFAAVLLTGTALGQRKNFSWDYPVRPGTPAWNQLDSYEARLAAYNIPERLLRKLSTSELVDICLRYPEWRLVNTRNSFQQGYEYLKTIFNGFAELERRTDSGRELLKLYKGKHMDDVETFPTLEQKGAFTFNISYLELLLSQRSVLQNITDKKELLRVSVDKYEMKKKFMHHYSVYGLMTPGMIMARTLDLQGNAGFSKKKSEASTLRAFVADQNLHDIQMLDELAAMASAAAR